jgi:hypothetical protein
MNALMLDAEAHPPDVELREAMDAARREGDAVVGPDRPRQAELAEGVLEDRPGTPALDVRQAPTGEQIACVLIANCERIAPHPVARGELPFKVSGPEIVRGVSGWGNDAGMLMRLAPAALLHQALAGEEIPRRAYRGPRVGGDLGMPRREPVEQLAGPPIRMPAPRRAQQVSDLRRAAVWTVVRGVAPVPQAAPPVLVETVEPLVARLATDAVAGTELRPRVEAQPFVGAEAFALLHG